MTHRNGAPTQARKMLCARQAIHAPGERAGQDAKHAIRSESGCPSRRFWNAAVDGEHGSDPRTAGDDEEQRVEKATNERHLGSRAEENDKQNADANPGINAEIKTSVGKRKRSAGQRSENVGGRNRESAYPDGGRKKSAQARAASVLHDGLETSALEAFLGGVGGFEISNTDRLARGNTYRRSVRRRRLEISFSEGWMRRHAHRLLFGARRPARCTCPAGACVVLAGFVDTFEVRAGVLLFATAGTVAAIRDDGFQAIVGGNFTGVVKTPVGAWLRRSRRKTRPE